MKTFTSVSKALNAITKFEDNYGFSLMYRFVPVEGDVFPAPFVVEFARSEYIDDEDFIKAGFKVSQ